MLFPRCVITFMVLLMGTSAFAKATGDYSCVVQGPKGIYLGKRLTATQIDDLFSKAQQSSTGAPEKLAIGSYAGADYSIEFYSRGISLVVIKDGQEMRASGAGMNATYSARPLGSNTAEISFSCLQHVLE